MEIRAFLRRVVCALCGLATLIASAASVDTKAHAADCFATDNDGVYDQDGAANGIITVTAASTPAVPPAATAYDCTGLDFVVESAGLLTFESNVTTGEVVALEVGDLQIDAGGAIRADAEGCPGVLGADPVSGDGSAPNDSNVCVKSATGSGIGWRRWERWRQRSHTRSRTRWRASRSWPAC